MKISRVERKKRAAKRKEEIQKELLDIMDRELRSNHNFEAVCTAADEKVALLIRIKPQEKTLILAAVADLTKEFETIFEAQKREEEIE